MARFLDDFHPGEVFESGPHTITGDEIIAFARQFDPQSFHTDPQAAKASFFGKHVASGWHTAALTMRMLTESQLDIAGGVIGAGTEKLKWPVALVPGDTIHVRVEVVSARASASRPAIGIVKLRVQTLRDDGVAVQEMVANVVVPTRSA